MWLGYTYFSHRGEGLVCISSVQMERYYPAILSTLILSNDSVKKVVLEVSRGTSIADFQDYYFERYA